MKKILYTLITLVMMAGGMECSAQTVSGQMAGHDYVDLGLPSGTKWATCNVGASKPTEKGDRFAWGETKTKKNYSNENYKWWMLSDYGQVHYVLKYRTLRCDTADNKKVLDVEDDAAATNWGSAWRMPTTAEQEELIAGCNWATTANFKGSGMPGMVGTSKVNGKTIFFPAFDTFEDGTFMGRYWSSSNYDDFSSNCIFLDCEENKIENYTSWRGYGQCVRAVVEERMEYLVEFYSDNVMIGSQKVKEGLAAYNMVEPKKLDYKFVGWNDSSFMNVKSNLKVYARFKKYEFVSGNVGTHSYVDLGLPSGTKWASCNVGATKPAEYGDYFAWGETKTKKDFSWNTYKLCENKITSDDLYPIPKDFSKYSTNRLYGIVDNRRDLEAIDDAATVNWGSGWRMPTVNELVELINGCEWSYFKDFNFSGMSGVVGTSKVNGNIIFLPCKDDAMYSNYWSSSLSEESSACAYYLTVNGDNRFFYVGYVDWYYSTRCSIFFVRAVVATPKSKAREIIRAE